MPADLAGDDWCHLCGCPLVNGICPRCDRPRRTWPGRLGSPWGYLHLRHGRRLAVAALAAVGLVVAAFGFGWFGNALSAHRSAGTVSSPSQTPTSPAGGPANALAAGSTFAVLGDDMDAFGNRPRRGYAFVIHTGSQTSDLLTDYQLIVASYLQGTGTVDLQRGDQTFTATVVAVSPEPHVALLRVSGLYPSLPISATAPKPGDTVTVGEPASGVARHAAVVANSGPGGSSHLTFSVEVANPDDGTPVLNSAGQVVGLAEPTSPYHVQGVGFAIPILSACMAVGAC